MATTLLITGGTGLIGTFLCNEFTKNKIKVKILTHNETVSKKQNYYYWDIKKSYIDPEAFADVDYIIHLAGVGVSDKKWTPKRKKAIEKSRVLGTRLLFNHAQHAKIKGILASSAIGYYGHDTGSTVIDESASKGRGFLADVVRNWEKESLKFTEICSQVVLLRFGLVLSKNGGLLKKMLPPFNWNLGSGIGSGKQWMSWIHIQDIYNIVDFLIQKDCSGTFNVVSPTPTTNQDFTKILAQSLQKAYFMPNIPSFLLKWHFGEMSEIILGGNRVLPKNLQSLGFKFAFDSLDEALKDILQKDD